MKEKTGRLKGFWKKITQNPDLIFGIGMIVAALFLSWRAWRGRDQSAFWIFAILLLVILAGVFWGVIAMREKGVALHKQFLLVGIVFGVLFILILPPGQSPDEKNHFRRAYGISEGAIVASQGLTGTEAVGSNLPVEAGAFDRSPRPGTYERVSGALSQEDSGEKTDQVYTNTALYNFVCYLPQTLAALVGKLLHASSMVIAYLMEIFNFVVWIMLTYYAIKIIPKFKKVILFVALLPITLQEATSMAPDALTIGMSFLLIAYVLHLAYNHKRKAMSRKELIVLYAIAILIGFCKIVYFPLVLLYLVIPEKVFGNKKKKWIHLGIIFGVTLVLNLIWLSISSNFLIEINPGVKSSEQMAGILGNPAKYLVVMLDTINAHCQAWLANMLGSVLGSYSIYLPGVLLFSSFAVLVTLFIQRDERVELKKYDRMIFITVFATILVLIFTSLYLQWTVLGSEIIDGIQGRYFLPILLLIPVMLSRKSNKKVATLISERGVMYYTIMIDAVALMTILAKNV